MEKEKLYLSSNGKEVSFGDKIECHFDNGHIKSVTMIIINNDTIPMLKAAGVLTTKVDSANLEMTHVIERLAERLNWKPQKVVSYLSTLAEINPMAAFNVAVKEIAIILDGKYPDHINKSEKIYCISTLDGRIHEICKNHIKNYRNFAAFRSVEDAKVACNILREPLKEMFRSGK